jgi:hypothetical protein
MKSLLKKIIYNSEYNYYCYKKYKFKLKNRKNRINYGTDIVVCGLNRSGSTLAYNILNYILQKSYKPSLGFFSDEKAYIEELKQPKYSILRKTHDYSFILKNRIENKQTIGIFSHRHLLDVIASHVQKGWVSDIKDFVSQYGVEKLVYNSIIMAKIRGIIIISYEELLNEKEKIIQRIASQLELSLSAEQIQYIIYETSIEKTQENISILSFDKIGNDLVNKETGLHINHINDPDLNKWKKVLSEKDVNLITGRKAYGYYNKFFGYV